MTCVPTQPVELRLARGSRDERPHPRMDRELLATASPRPTLGFCGFRDAHTAGRLIMAALLGARGWFSHRHTPAGETALIVGFYASYEAARGLVGGARQSAIQRAHEILTLERSLHLFAEPQVQRLARDIPGLLGTLSVAYLSLHLAATGGLLLWLYRRRPTTFPLVRTTLIIASALSLIGFLAFPTAPPRMAATGLSDTVSHAAVSLNHGLISTLYNPYAALPSMHAAYALIVGAAVMRYGRGTLVRLIGALYPPFVLLVITATGNHFFFDAATGAVVAAVSTLIALPLARARPQAETLPLLPHRGLDPARTFEQAA
jgi:PAP2 superfamily